MLRNVVRRLFDTMRHTRHRVSTKVVLLNTEGSKALIAEYAWGGFGLPGGHIDGIEHPDDALRRELYEELGLTSAAYHALEQHGFARFDKRVILLYKGVLHHPEELKCNPREVVRTHWITAEDIHTHRVDVGAYGEYILQILDGNSM